MAQEIYPSGLSQNTMGMPRLPSLQEVLGTGTPNVSSENIFKLLQAPQGRATEALPGIQELLFGSQAPAVQAIREGARSNVAAAQSDAMRRGLTGSDIEAAAMGQARASGEQQVGQLIAQQSSVLAQYIMQALGMDIQANREQFVTLAQAIGQELTARRDIEQSFRDSELASREGASGRRSQLYGAGIGAVGSILGGFASRGG